MWSDNETSLDLLGYRHLIGAVLDIVREDGLLPATIGVFGDWGSGKSSLIQMARAEIERDKETLVLTFNGWLFEGYEDAKTALMGSVIDELAEHKTFTVRGRGLVVRLVHRINFLHVAGSASRMGLGYAAAGFPGLAFGAMPDLAAVGAKILEKAKDVEPEEMEKFLREDPGKQLRRSVREFRKDFTELLDETKLKRLVVIVDDLDRCNPDTIIETLEAIKLFLFVPKTTFIIGADERLIRYAVRRRFPEFPGERADSVGRDYLEKLVQFPIRIPPMGRAETEKYIKLLLADRCDLQKDAYERIRSTGVASDSRLDATLDRKAVASALGAEPSNDLDEALALAERIGPVLAAGLSGNPRQCKRFLNTLVMRLQMAKSRGINLGRRVLAKLMLLEYLRPESFKELASLQAAQSGKPREITAAEGALNLSPHENANAAAEEKADQVSLELGKAASGPKPSTLAPKRAPPQTETVPTTGFMGWQSDAWLSDWLASEPRLAGEDLRPYFYFARDRPETLAGFGLRMSPEAQEALAKVLGPVEAERTAALARAAQFSTADAAAIFEALGNRVRETEAPSAVNSPLVRMCEWVDARAELFGEFVIFLKTLPHAAVPFAFVPRLVQLGSTLSERKPQIIALLDVWKGSPNPLLKKAAVAQLQKISK